MDKSVGPTVAQSPLHLRRLTNDIHSCKVYSMSSAKLIYDQRLRFLDGRFEARIKAYEVTKSKKFPDGLKLLNTS